ncbi:MULTISPECIES: UTP--glucose-1-phosphate uridylyltransferase GalU [unclassified Nitrosospira]|uniref:UTP--glucose-1-phosphate uridylyltransferase GalU n=1 Tax=unclassified Nitrosospira TaxID=2609267 RepID=UPI000D3090D5|nr:MULTISPECIES: UTP--glucose-1-phosphate uridylyltransferase GalU [unclassified Nitrosospira]PTR13473.1 UDP-glucose pyrophosphorylase [Nitrosospira sp. Nsp2]WON72950.1 UTP--glucose-1-phosphate uridylyltransferase GalU [Nitrosospira sp. Is2]
MPKITKAVFPVAGMGTRFLPATKASPKEMMPVVDKPLIQYAVEEAIAAGITELIFITGRHKRAIEDHFDKAFEMEAELEAKGKSDTLEMLRSILPKNISCIYIRQSAPLGLGHAILCSRPAVGNVPFAVLLADDLLVGEEPIIGQMCHMYEQNGCSILAVQNVEREETASYGIVECGPGMHGLHPITGIVEKPAPENAPSTLGVVGRYVLTPQIFAHLEKITPGAGGEIQLTDGIASLLQEEPALAYEFAGTRYDCGSKIGYLKATIALALEHPEVGREFARYLDARCQRTPSA